MCSPITQHLIHSRINSVDYTIEPINYIGNSSNTAAGFLLFESDLRPKPDARTEAN